MRKGSLDPSAFGTSPCRSSLITTSRRNVRFVMSSAAVNLGLAEDLPDHVDLDEARTLIEALAGLVTAAAPPRIHV